MEIIANNKGGEKICLNGFMYTLNCIRKNKLWWKCVERNSGKCRASISTDLRRENTEIGQPHNHAPDETKISVAKLKNFMRERALNTEDKPVQIYSQGVSQFDESVCRLLPSSEVCKRTIRRHRSSLLPAPNRRDDLGDMPNKKVAKRVRKKTKRNTAVDYGDLEKDLVPFEFIHPDLPESSHQGYPDKQGTTKTKNVSATVSSKDPSSQLASLSQPTAAKFQKKTGSQLENQCFGNKEQKAMPNSVQPSPPAPTQMHAHLLVAASSQPAPLQVSVAKQKLVENPRPQEKRIFVVADHQRCVMSNLASLWKSGKLCDAGIGNGSSTVMVHKLVLSAVCPKLFSVFNMDIKSQEFLQVNFPKEVSTEALNAFAEYMYNGILDLDHDILEQLKIIAKRLDMKEFEQLCDSHLSSHIYQAASAPITNVPLIQTTMQIPAMTSTLDSYDSAISTSMQSTPSQDLDNQQKISKVEPGQVHMEPAAVFSQESEMASLSTNKSGNAAGFVICPSIKIEPVGPEDDRCGLWSGSSHNQAFTSTNSSSPITAAATASPSIASVPVSSTEFAISSSEPTDIKSTRLKTTHSCGAPLISDLSSVSNIVETGHSQTSSMNENSSQPSDSLPSVDTPTKNNAVYPIRLISAKGDNLPLLTTDSSDAMTVNSFIPSEET